MTKRDIKRQEIAKRKQIRLAAKEIKDKQKLEKSLAFQNKRKLAEQKRKDKLERAANKEQLRTLITQRRHEAIYDDIHYLVNTKIPNAIKRGDTNYVICSSLLFEIRHASFALASSKTHKFNLSSQGKVAEHVNGRTNIGIYGAYLILIGKITNWQDFYNFMLKFGCWIETSAQFNMHIEKFQNQRIGAIRPEVYIREYENYFNISLSDNEKNEFSQRFLFREYGLITKDMIIDYVREKLQK